MREGDIAVVWVALFNPRRDGLPAGWVVKGEAGHHGPGGGVKVGLLSGLPIKHPREVVRLATEPRLVSVQARHPLKGSRSIYCFQCETKWPSIPWECKPARDLGIGVGRSMAPCRVPKWH